MDETINPFKVSVALRPETTRTIRDGEPRTAASTFPQFLNSDVYLVQIQCCFTSTETTRTLRDGEPRTATSTFTQLLSSDYKPGEALRFDTHVRRPHTHVKNLVVHVRVRWVMQTSR